MQLGNCLNRRANGLRRHLFQFIQQCQDGHRLAARLDQALHKIGRRGLTKFNGESVDEAV